MGLGSGLGSGSGWGVRVGLIGSWMTSSRCGRRSVGIELGGLMIGCHSLAMIVAVGPIAGRGGFLVCTRGSFGGFLVTGLQVLCVGSRRVSPCSIKPRRPR